MPPTISPPTPASSITATPITPNSFSPFGSVIQVPPSTAITANQGTARKHPKVSPVTTSPPASGVPSSLNINIFVCAPRKLTGSSKNIFNCAILERHPYSSQSFIPLGLSPNPNNEAGSRYLVIVAPSLLDQEGSPPDLKGLRAFVCNGSQGVTYAAGTWHAPMVALGEREIEFAVLVGENGVEGEDTQEILIGDGGIDVRVLEVGGGEGGLWAKLKARL